MSRHPTTIRLTPEQQSAIDTAAAAQGISRSQWITAAIEASLSGVTTPATTGDYARPELVDIERRLSAIERKIHAVTTPERAALPAGEPEPLPPAERPAERPAAAHHKPAKGGTPPASLARLIELKEAGESHVTTAAKLNAEGHKRGTGIGWDAAAVGVHWKKEQQRRSA